MTPTVSADEIVAAMTATQGNVARAADRLCVTTSNLRGHAYRRGVDLTALRQQCRAMDVPSAPDTGDALPSTYPVLAAALVDMAAMGVAMQETQAELEQRDRIIATLTRELEAHA